MNQWAELVTSWSRGAAVYDVYRYAFSRLLSVGVVDRITFVDTAAACRHPVAKDATLCDDGLTDGCPQQMPVSAQTSIIRICRPVYHLSLSHILFKKLDSLKRFVRTTVAASHN